MPSETLDRWFGPRLSRGASTECSAIIGATKEDPDHPRNDAVRGCIHRGAKVSTTENYGIRYSHNAPERAGWVPATTVLYPEDQEG